MAGLALQGESSLTRLFGSGPLGVARHLPELVRAVSFTQFTNLNARLSGNSLTGSP